MCGSGALLADTATLQVSIEGGSFNTKFKFFDASAGCPSYNDIPGAKQFLGGVRASDKGASKQLPLGEPIHVFLFRPKDTPGISAAGGASEIRRRALQVTLMSDATLRYTEIIDHVPSWEATGDIRVEPATACLPADEAEAAAEGSTEAPTETSDESDSLEADQGQDTGTDADQ
jgi:hypothetical protein